MADQQQNANLSSETLPLIVASDDPLITEALKALSVNAVPEVAPTCCSTIEEALAQDTQSPVLVPVRMPLDRLQQALMAEEPPEAALDAWCSEHEALLRTCRKARRRVVIMDATMLVAQPVACAEALGRRLGVHFGPVAEAKAKPGSELSPIHATIAATLIASHERTLRLADELEAMILGPASARTPSRDDISAAAKCVANLATERDLLRENLKLMLAETERLMGEKSASETKAESTNAELVEKHLLKAQFGAVSRQLQEAQHASALRESILGAEILHLAAQTRQERDRLCAELQTVHDEIARIHASSSWKVTKPMRAVRQGLKRP